MTDANEQSLFERLGGDAGVSAAVEELYDRIMGDDELAPFFVGVDVSAVQRHQRELVTSAVGGPSVYAGRSIRDAHEGYAIEPRHLDLLIEHLTGALSAVGVGPTDTATVVGLVDRLWHAQFWST